MNIIERVRTSGKCPPSLLLDTQNEAGFETAVANVLDANELMLSIGNDLSDDFKSLMQMAEKSDVIRGDKDQLAAILAQRRCIILAIVGATPPNNSSLGSLLQAGFLSSVKVWLDDILNGTVGGVDLLLHLLGNIAQLPVTKSVVKDSGMGKAIGSVEKSKICVGSPNEAAIKGRIKCIKDAWNKSVKALKEMTAPKRDIHSIQSESPPAAKKTRVEETKKTSFSTLLKKMEADSPGLSSQKASLPKATGSTNTEPLESKAKADDQLKKDKKKQCVKWQDHFGGDLTASKTIESGEEQIDDTVDSAVSWSDRKKRDRMREKELLAKVKKSKLMDDDDDDMGMGMERTPAPTEGSIPAATIWKVPSILPERTDAPPPQVNSLEIATQTARIANVTKAMYISEYNVPPSPAPMSDVEQALDMTNQSSTVTQAIPFFVPQQVPESAPAAPAPAPATTYHQIGGPSAGGWAAPQQTALPPAGVPNIATPEFVQSLGLPMFLVGQDVQALQTLSITPSLLSTFVDSNGMYDQARLTSLVQTLSQSSAPAQQAPPMGQMGAGGFHQRSAYGPGGQPGYPGAAGGGGGGVYGPASGGGAYGPGSGGGYGGGSWQGGMKTGYRGTQNNGEGNLHVSGYGPATTQADIITLFTPYVKVDEVVMKGTFSFVNTSDSSSATRAREALAGALLGGSPIRINLAQRKKRDDVPPSFGGANTGSFYGGGDVQSNGAFTANPPMNQGAFPPVATMGAPPPQAVAAGGDVSNVRDDRGNPATKNLFVAGYGPGTPEQQLRDLFGQHAQIIGIIMKGTFSFVNTSDKVDAVRAREALSGTMFNGGVLRINFAKESGRLGTSFDVTYNGRGGGERAGGERAGGGGGPPPSHYGRGF